MFDITISVQNEKHMFRPNYKRREICGEINLVLDEK